jgi:hypothetical protein
MTKTVPPITRQEIDRILATEGYQAAKAAADRAGIIWFASSGTTRKS